ncbi:MAG: hypothetical protein ACRD4O_13740, partial [Bryobacteraceae bacterium]
MRTIFASVLLVFLCPLTTPSQRTTAEAERSSVPRTHVYYIAAQEVLWNYAPHGRHLAGLPHPETEEAGGPEATNTT